jgi:predicted secreted hydrolase
MLVGIIVLIYLDRNPPTQEPRQRAGFELNQLLGAEHEGGNSAYLAAGPGAILRFPADHLQHPGYRNEWWYLTGQLRGRDEPSLRFGFQLTLFRFALAPPDDPVSAAQASNPWLSPQLYMGHFAMSHMGEQEHRAAERFSRAGPGLAGSEGDPPRIWLQNWSLQGLEPGQLFPLQLSARDPEQEIGLELQAQTLKPRLLQGDRGLSIKNRGGGASYYYSYPRLAVEGVVEWSGRHFPVAGQAWYDHEWSSNALAAHQLGWDWFSLQLDDGQDLMFYLFRNRDGSPGKRQLSLVDARGKRVPVDAGEVVLEVVDEWISPEGRRYPAAWQLAIPSRQLRLEIRPLIADQEMRLSVTYWEGAVTVEGTHRGGGYVELSGY